VNAGHLPIAVATPGFQVVTLDSTGPRLGLLPGLTRAGIGLDLDEGTTLVIVTDGITERAGPDGEYGIQRVLSLIAERERASASALVHAILTDSQTYAAGAPAEDDLTIVTVRLQRLPAPAVRAAMAAES
jgi:phosphoserine phosphatase RsbU/P